MSVVAVRLLGRPSVTIDGEDRGQPRGAKVWGLLAYLASSDRAHTRSELAELLFAGAVDPLGALRWNLAALRRTLDRPDALKGNPIRLDRSDITVDTVRLDEDDPEVPVDLDCGQGLLEGIDFPDSAVFELWLEAERHRFRRRLISLTRRSALDALTLGDHDRSVHLAAELVASDPYDEGSSALLIRALAAGGDRDAARRQFEQCAELLRRELGTEPGPAVLAAANVLDGSTTPPPRMNNDQVFGRIDVAWQSFLSGSVEHALDLGRAAVQLADRSEDPTLRYMSRIFLAAMLNISVRCWDESATVTTEALRISTEEGDASLEAIALSVMAGNELMLGDYASASRHATSGVRLSDDSDALALNLAFLSAVETDTGQMEAARAHAAEAIAQAERNRDPVRLAYAFSYAAHADITDGRHDSARGFAAEAVEACSSILVLKPWPMAMLAEIDVRSGRLEMARTTATKADGLATATGMSYQRALAHRALALADAAGGDDDAALDRLTIALTHARHTAGQGYVFHWPVAWVLETLAMISARSRPTDQRSWAGALKVHALATGMEGFAARAEHLLATSPSVGG